ncbi:hypothetical protein ACFQ3Z_22920 [Streptomyces nogalater]
MFDHQLKESDRDVLRLLFTFGGKVDLSVLGKAYLAFANRGSSHFKASLRILNGTLVRLFDEGAHSYVEFSNPSVNDFMLMKFSEESDLIVRVLKNPYSFDQVALLWSYHDAPADAGLPARLNLTPFRAEVEEAAMATLDCHETATHSKAGRAAICLNIAGSMHVPSVENWAVRRLKQPGFVYGGSTGDIISLIRITDVSANRRIRQLHDSVRLEGLTSLFNRDRGDHGLFIAASHAMDLAEFVDDGIREDLCGQADEMFEALLEQYSRDPDGVDPEMIDSGLDYILRYDDLWQHKWPSAATLLESWLPEEAESLEGSEEESDIDPEYIDGDAYLTMNSLSFLE